jgi:peptide/nickel transport system permease protein
MRMSTYIIRRLLVSIPILIGITVLVFFFIASAPGDPVSAFIRPELANNAEIRRIIVERYGLDQPLYIRYLRWLAEALQGNLGYSAIGGLPILDTVIRGLLASASLMLTALLIGIVVGIPVGVFSALRQYSRTDFALTGIAFLGISTPSFLLGIGALWLLGLQIRIFPIGGMQDPTQEFNIPDFVAHLLLPAMVLGVGYLAYLMRYSRAAMLEVIHTQYVTTAESKGLPYSTVILRHAFRNALIPILTIIGVFLPEMVGGAVITESVFSWPGIGLMMVQGVAQRDYPMIMGISLFVGIAVLFANLLTDVLYAVADPRIRY